MSAPRFGLRVGPGYPWKRHIGDVITFGNSSREQVEDIREQMTTGKWHEVVELDQNGQVIEPRCPACAAGLWTAKCTWGHE